MEAKSTVPLLEMMKTRCIKTTLISIGNSRNRCGLPKKNFTSPWRGEKKLEIGCRVQSKWICNRDTTRFSCGSSWNKANGSARGYDQGGCKLRKSDQWQMECAPQAWQWRHADCMWMNYSQSWQWRHADGMWMNYSQKDSSVDG